MQLRSIGLVLGAIALAGAAAFYGLAQRRTPAPVPAMALDRVIVVVLETYRPREIDPAAIMGKDAMPSVNRLAAENRVAVNYYGVWSPSLPNYLAMIGGSTFGVSSNAESCFNPDHGKDCNGADAKTLVDQLETANISWEGLFESMPSPGFMGALFPQKPVAIYAEKHNPFAYFKAIAESPARLAKLKPLDIAALKAELADPAAASRFIFIVPNLCNDTHGASACRSDAEKLADGDRFLAELVPAIVGSPAFTERSVLFITWDNAEHGHAACCGSWWGGGRIPLIAVTKHPNPVRGTTPANHYSLLATIEDGFGLPRLANAIGSSTLFDLLPDFAAKPMASALSVSSPAAPTH